MGKPSYREQVLVLKKTNLGEADLIVTLLGHDGAQIRAVAKSARKPRSSFAARVDLFATCDVLLAPGKSLEVLSDARLVAARMPLRTDVARMAAAAPVIDALARVTQQDLPVARLFEMANAALDVQETCEVDVVPAITAAFLVKLSAILGVRPSFAACVGCGAPTQPLADGRTVYFSYTDGGVVCPDCSLGSDHVRMPFRTIACAQSFLGATFAQIVEEKPDLNDVFGVLTLCQSWLRSQLGTNLKSLSYLFTCGLF